MGKLTRKSIDKINTICNNTESLNRLLLLENFMTNKTFTVAGIATDTNQVTKVRYANSLDKRLLRLMQTKFTNIIFVQLQKESTKKEACEYLLTLSQFENYFDLIKTELKKKSPKQNVSVQDILSVLDN